MKMEKFENTALEAMVYEAVKEIQDIKRDNRQVPDYASENEIYNSIKVDTLEALRSLYRKRLISFHKTINGINMFGIKPTAHE